MPTADTHETFVLNWHHRVPLRVNDELKLSLKQSDHYVQVVLTGFKQRLNNKSTQRLL